MFEAVMQSSKKSNHHLIMGYETGETCGIDVSFSLYVHVNGHNFVTRYPLLCNQALNTKLIPKLCPQKW